MNTSPVNVAACGGVADGGCVRFGSEDRARSRGRQAVHVSRVPVISAPGSLHQAQHIFILDHDHLGS